MQSFLIGNRQPFKNSAPLFCVFFETSSPKLHDDI